MKRIIVVMMLTLMAGNSAAVEDEIAIFEFSLLNLQNNEYLVVDYSYQGCWEGGAAELKFDGKSVSINAKYPLISNLVHDLSLDESLKLDKYFTYIDGLVEPGGCSTVTRMNLMLHRNNELIKSRELIDGTCDYNHSKNLLSPQDLHDELVRIPHFEEMTSKQK